MTVFLGSVVLWYLFVSSDGIWELSTPLIFTGKRNMSSVNMACLPPFSAIYCLATGASAAFVRGRRRQAFSRERGCLFSDAVQFWFTEEADCFATTISTFSLVHLLRTSFGASHGWSSFEE